MRRIRRDSGRRAGAGTTLIELVVALAVLGILLGVSTAALGAVHREGVSPTAALLRAAQTKALRTGVVVHLALPDSTGRGAPTSVLFLPDGRVVGRGYDPLTGATSDATR